MLIYCFYVLKHDVSNGLLCCQKAKSGKATSNQVPVELLAACADNVVTLGLLHRLVADIFEDIYFAVTFDDFEFWRR